jgi:BlaI family transcriptional regulator, penicillinase repressor
MGKPSELGELQLAILRVLWKKKEASAADVHAALGGRRDLAITTVSTILTRLERRGIVSHRTVGRTFVYRPTITEASVRTSMLRSLVDSMFSRDPTAVVSQLLTSRDISPGDLDRMRELIDESRRQSRKKRG